VILPAPDYRGLTLEEAIAKRRSIRTYAARPLSLAAISQLAHAAQGITGRLHGHRLRAAPSAGAMYPFELYLIAGQVENLATGLYRYEPEEHALVFLREGDLRAPLARAALGQHMITRAAATFVLTAVPARTQVRYGERSWRYIYMEAGHISQNLYLQATSLGLGTVVIGAFNDEAVNSLLTLDPGRETAVFIQPVGPLSP
jgi:SagB-type dehydrogenase family enzyme